MDIMTASLDDLYVRLGRELQVDGFGGDDFELLRARAKTWMLANGQRIRSVVCGVPSGIADQAVTLATMADSLAALYGKPTAYTVAAIIAKTGLDRFCSGDADQ